MLARQSTVMRIAPGLLLATALAALALLVVRLPGFSFLGVLMTGMLLGLAWQAAVGLREAQAPGVEWSIRVLLKLGVVLLGTRLDLGALLDIGSVVLLGAVLVVGGGVYLVYRITRWLGVGPGLSLALAVGTSVCGASAILACASVVRLKREDAGLAVAIISVVGIVAAIALALLGRLLGAGDAAYGLLVGLSLQELGHVLSAGYALGDGAGDLATTVKMVRVALLAPLLLVIARFVPDGQVAPAVAAPKIRVPPFLVGFFALAVVNSLFEAPVAVVTTMQWLSAFALAVSMVGIGLASRVSLFGKLGRQALVAGAAAFLVVGGMAAAYVWLVAG